MSAPLITRDHLESVFGDFNNRNIMVIGDVMLDAYWWGKVSRISPEAPVPVILMEKKEHRLGGAANVALNLKKLGANPLLFSVVGDDHEGFQFFKLLECNDISGDFILKSSTRPTTVKTRIIGNHQQQLLRVDTETDEDINPVKHDHLKKLFNQVIDKLDAIVFEDYDKGLLDGGLIEYIIARANSKKIPTIVDPKKKNFFSYAQSTLFKPNLKELREGMRADLSKPVRQEELHDVSRMLIDKTGIKSVMITLSDEGIYICDRYKDYLVGTHKRSVYDVSGAGDTVASVAALSLACDLDIHLIAELSNIAGGLVCEKVGVVPIEKDELFYEAVNLLTGHS